VSLKSLIGYAIFFAIIIFNSGPFTEDEDFVMANRNIEEIDLNLRDNEAVFSFLELSSGESTLIQNSAGKTVLLNTGAKESRDEIQMHMDIFKIKSIDYLILTNLSEYHTGNVSWLVDEIGVKKIVVASGMESRVKELLGNKNSEIITVSEGSKITPFENLTFQFLYSGTNVNDGALALSMLYGKINILYMGISDASIEKMLAKKYDLKNTQILKVGYFGSEEGTSQQFLESVDPQVAIIFTKRNKLPSQEVMERLEGYWIDVFQPNNQGIVLIKCTKEYYDVTIIPTREEKPIL
jgi:competence protein ComEC